MRLCELPGNLQSKIMPEPMSGCWLWIGAAKNSGHGALHRKGRTILAHRFIWELFFGPIMEGLEICHRCDVPSCVNPHHLFAGTHTDNMRDMVQKGRSSHLRGSAQAQAKLKEADIPVILADTRPYRVIGKDFGVSKGTITRIKNGRNWKHAMDDGDPHFLEAFA